DLAGAEDVTESEATKLLRDRAIEDVVIDAAGSLVFFGGGKLLKVTGASGALKRLAQRYLTDEAAAPVAAQATRRYIKPGDEGIGARVLESFPVVGAGKQVSEQAASRVNSQTTHELVARDLGLPP